MCRFYPELWGEPIKLIVLIFGGLGLVAAVNLRLAWLFGIGLSWMAWTHLVPRLRYIFQHSRKYTDAKIAASIEFEIIWRSPKVSGDFQLKRPIFIFQDGSSPKITSGFEICTHSSAFGSQVDLLRGSDAKKFIKLDGFAYLRKGQPFLFLDQGQRIWLNKTRFPMLRWTREDYH